MDVFLPLSATILSVALNLSPLKTIREIQEQGDVGTNSFVPFFAICLNAVLAFLYGLYIYNQTIMFVNFIGVTLSTYYIWHFYNYTRDKQTVRTLLLSASVFIVVILYHIYFRAGENGRLQLGLISNFATICMFAAPLSTVPTIIRTKNASSIPVYLSIASFACSLAWFLYGVKLWDFFVMVPNFLGLLLSSLQLALVKMYGQRKASKMELSDV